jgi:hypothetical protein
LAQVALRHQLREAAETLEPILFLVLLLLLVVVQAADAPMEFLEVLAVAVDNLAMALFIQALVEYQDKVMLVVVLLLT